MIFAHLRNTFSRWFLARPKADEPQGSITERPTSMPEEAENRGVPEATAAQPLQTSTSGMAANPIAYDEHLLERSRTQWHFGDWQSLAKLNQEDIRYHPDRAKLAVLAAAGRLQIDKIDDAKQYIRLAQDWGVSKKLLARILAAGVHNSLGRAAAIAGEQPRALQHFEAAIQIGSPGSDRRLLARARIHEQFNSLGLGSAPLSAAPCAPTLLSHGKH